MRIEDISRTQWIIISLLLGAATGWLNTNWSTSNLTQTHPQTDLEGGILREPIKGSDGSVFPWVRGVTIYPPVEAGFDLRTKEGTIRPRKSAVTYQMLKPAPERKGWVYQNAVTLVDDPYKPGFNQIAKGNIASHLDETAKTRDWVHYRYAWWVEPQYAYPVWMGGFLLVVGIAWPTIQKRMVSAGYGRAPEPETKSKEPSFLKRLFTRARSESQVQPSRPATSLSQDDLDRIAKMEEGLKDFVATGPQGDKELGGEFDENATPQVRKLDATPDAAPEPEQKTDEPKDYGGEFYPTVAHGHAKKKPDEQP